MHVHVVIWTKSISEDYSQYSVIFVLGRNDSNHDLAQDWYTVSGLSTLTLFQSFDSNFFPIYKIHARLVHG